MEIERKYLIHTIPFDLSSFPFRTIEQGYLCTNPVVRIRKDNDRYELLSLIHISEPTRH